MRPRPARQLLALEIQNILPCRATRVAAPIGGTEESLVVLKFHGNDTCKANKFASTWKANKFGST